MPRSIIALLVIISLSSCNILDNKVNEVIIENRYSMELPMTLTEAPGLNELASLQYRHFLNTYYVLVIDEPKSDLGPMLIENQLTNYYSDDFEGYSDIIHTNLEAALEEMQPTEMVDTLINGLPAKLMSFTGTVENLPLFYDMALVEGKTDYYQIMTWTLQSERNKCEESMHKILLTFKEVDGGFESIAPVENAKTAPSKSGSKR